ncbi:hypothetical protein AUR64_01060 [Haloprofundus marisrubri]|uniref:Uncharacterized protein n=1 Tax=Haloprofundus marisrubri TaxID=1514971 RepID=A0A0W1R472_9EURY|nr:hypothetical protein [Haloprofundus marisrubri]KTG08193.1 hypothetical protein AUR64_01060 [Haloprofundus marisrubri]
MSESRRTFVRGIGATLLAVGVAGCTDMGGQTGDGNDDAQAQEGETDTGNDTETGAETETETTATDTDTPTETASNDTAGNGTANDTADTNATGNASDVQGTVGEQSQQDLQIVEHSYFQRGGQSGVEGMIRNTGDTTYELVTVHITPRADETDESAKQYPEQQVNYRDTLAPDATWEFEMAFNAPEGRTPDSYVIWVTGQENA